MRLTILILLFPVILSAQIWKGSGIAYTSTSPTHEPGARGAWVVVDTLTGQWYEYDLTANIWREMGARLQATNTTGAPSYTPTKQRGRFAINAGDSLYYYQGGTWTLLGGTGGGGGTDDQAISIDSTGRYITITLEDGGSVTFEDTDTPNTDDQAISIDSTGRVFTITLEDGGEVSFEDTDTQYDLSPYATTAALGDTANVLRGEFPVNTDNQVIDTFSIVSNTLRLSLEDDAQPFKSVDLSPYLDNTDTQDLSIDSVGRYFTITLTDGGSVTFQDQVGTPGAGDDWGAQTVVSDGTLSGAGITGDALKVDTAIIATVYSLVDTAAAIRGDFPVNTDNQTLSIDSTAVTGGRQFTLTIEDGNSVTFIDSIGSGGVNTDSTTVLFQDSILIYYTLNGVEYGRDTIRTSGSGGGGGVSGSGTTNYVSKWTGSTSQGDSQIFDNGSDIGIRNTSPVSGLHLSKTLSVNTGEFMTVSEVTSGNSVKMGLYYLSGFNRYPGIWLNQASPNTTNYAFLRDPDNNRTIFNSPADGFINFRVNNIDIARFGPTGKLGLGTGGFSDPFSTLDITSKGTTSSTGALHIRNSASGNLIYMSDAGDFTVYNEIRLGSPSGPLIKSGSGSPEGVVTAPVGSLYSRTDGGAGTTLYVKESGAGNVGWIPK